MDSIGPGQVGQRTVPCPTFACQELASRQSTPRAFALGVPCYGVNCVGSDGTQYRPLSHAQYRPLSHFWLWIQLVRVRWDREPSPVPRIKNTPRTFALGVPRFGFNCVGSVGTQYRPLSQFPVPFLVRTRDSHRSQPFDSNSDQTDTRSRLHHKHISPLLRAQKTPNNIVRLLSQLKNHPC